MTENANISRRGRYALFVAKVAYHFPILGNLRQNGEIQKLQAEYEPAWKCPEHLDLTEIEQENCKAELLVKKAAEGEERGKCGIVLQLHGGGYYGGMHNTYRDTAAMYIEVSGGYSVLTPDYRTAPENPYPAALQDAIACYEYILTMGFDPSEIVIAGDSAGGGLALALVLYLRNNERPMPGGLITMSAWTDLTASGASYSEHFGDDPIFGGTYNTLIYKNGYYRGADPWDPYISPVFGSYEDFPPTLMQVGEKEMLLDDTRDVARKLKEAGVPVREHIYPGMFHVFQLGLTLFPESAEAWNEVRGFFKKITPHQPPAAAG